MVSSWKLDSSSTYSSASSRSRSSAGTPRLPPTPGLASQARATSPSRVTTVLLALDPVMPTSGRLAVRANSSMSPITSLPSAICSAMAGVDTATPGLTIRRWARFIHDALKPPV